MLAPYSVQLFLSGLINDHTLCSISSNELNRGKKKNKQTKQTQPNKKEMLSLDTRYFDLKIYI